MYPYSSVINFFFPPMYYSTMSKHNNVAYMFVLIEDP